MIYIRDSFALRFECMKIVRKWGGMFCMLQVAGCRLKNGLLSLSEST